MLQRFFLTLCLLSGSSFCLLNASNELQEFKHKHAIEKEKRFLCSLYFSKLKRTKESINDFLGVLDECSRDMEHFKTSIAKCYLQFLQENVDPKLLIESFGMRNDLHKTWNEMSTRLQKIFLLRGNYDHFIDSPFLGKDTPFIVKKSSSFHSLEDLKRPSTIKEIGYLMPSIVAQKFFQQKINKEKELLNQIYMEKLDTKNRVLNNLILYFKKWLLFLKEQKAIIAPLRHNFEKKDQLEALYESINSRRSLDKLWKKKEKILLSNLKIKKPYKEFFNSPYQSKTSFTQTSNEFSEKSGR